MPSPVDLVTIHHEGAGTPSDVPRGAAGGYTYWIGASRWIHLRDVWHSYATLDFNHVSVDICFSGDRDHSQVTNQDIALLHGAFLDARNRGYVIPNPLVRPHKLSPGSSTVCPGTNVMARWSVVQAACQSAISTTKPQGDEMAAYPSRTKPSTTFRGAVVDIANNMIHLEAAATCNPNPSVLKTNPNPILTSYGTGPGKFTVVTANDLDEYVFDLP